MTMKVPKGAIFAKHEIGRHLYLWSKSKGKATSKHLIISAHGCTSSKKPIKLKYGQNFSFYCEHGFTQGGAMDIRKLASGYVEPRQVISNSALDYDYVLSKYQSSTESETYAYIAKGMHDLEAYYRDVLKLDDDTVQSFLMQHSGTVQMDVLTIRNRSCGTAPTFYETVKAVQEAGLKYDHIHCSFCRGFADKPNSGQQEPIPRGTSIFD
ncbi:putative adhesin [Vibrio amylolyticus]|uniref:putative adhesin n=1 Tax=Vibrio amylolyticus TaxID=2847292 RepID=UPI00354B5584